MQTIHDPVIFQWFFFLQKHAKEGEEDQKKHWEAFKSVYEEANKHFNFGLPEIPYHTNTLPQVSHSLISIPWKECKDSTLCTLEARTLLDTFYLHLGQAKVGEYEPTDFISLEPWHPEVLKEKELRHAYLGEAVCLYAEVDNGLSEEEFSNLSEKIVKCMKLKGSPPKGVLLPFGFFTLLSVENLEMAVIICFKDSNKEASKFIHSILTQLFLNRIKAKLIYQDYHSNRRKHIEEVEKELDNLLKKSQQKLPLKELEKLSKEISQHQADFIEKISIMEEELQTLRICIENIDSLLKESIWDKNRQWAEEYLRGDIALFIRQMEYDLHYFRITQQQADLLLQSFLTSAEVLGASWERKMTLILSVFALSSIAEAFSNELAWWWRLVIISSGVIIVMLGYYLWLRES